MLQLRFLQVKEATAALALLQHTKFALVLGQSRVWGCRAVGLLGHSKAGGKGFSQVIHGDSGNQSIEITWLEEFMQNHLTTWSWLHLLLFCFSVPVLRFYIHVMPSWAVMYCHPSYLKNVKTQILVHELLSSVRWDTTFCCGRCLCWHWESNYVGTWLYNNSNVFPSTGSSWIQILRRQAKPQTVYYIYTNIYLVAHRRGKHVWTSTNSWCIRNGASFYLTTTVTFHPRS